MDLSSVDTGQFAWWSFGLALAAALVFVAYSFVGTLVFGLFIYYATRPIYRQLRRALDSPSLAAAVSLVALVLPALALISYALTIVLQEIDRYATDTPIDLGWFGIDPDDVEGIADPESLLQNGLEGMLSSSNIGDVISSLESVFGTVAVLGIAAIHLFVMLALAFYLLREDHRLSRWFFYRFGDERGIVESFFGAVDRDFNSIFFGNILNAVLTGTIGVITYSILNVFAPAGASIPTPALVGLLAGIASLIPVVGMKLVYVPVAIALLIQSFLAGIPGGFAFVIAFAVISFVVVDTIPDLVLRPYVSGRSLHVGALMLAYTLGPLLFGWYGIFLMPMVLVCVVHFAKIVLPELLSGSPIEPYAIDPGHMTVETAPFEDAEPGSLAGESGGDAGEADGS
ncbi:AI-2E family transporter [Halolamina salifodinae]|uniref:Putative PurR-regulated permease PerM n=1 Tax=Halolamina salifodinae TaxID=1202767 RepID=A0A8T4GYN3_9EURY|nr:AI-2E family transporter [Halolamina salifodinae]MBP1988106.1 putative PurR-regulated permease PerM [Halolamina salifodinae]